MGLNEEISGPPETKSASTQINVRELLYARMFVRNKIDSQSDDLKR